MGTLVNPGTQNPVNAIFASGQVDVKTLSTDTLTRLSAIQSISIKPDKKIVDLRSLNTQKALAKFVTEFKVSGTMELKSFNMDFAKAFFLAAAGSPSSLGGGVYEYDLYDGQPTTISQISITGYEGPANTLPFQCQLYGVVIKSLPVDYKMGELGTMKIDWEAIDYSVFNGLNSQ